MRPIVRGGKPANLDIKHYRDAAEPLRERIGAFCSYCEKPLSDVTDVEHVRPVKHFPDDKLEWDNLLLACSSCNRNKWDNPKDDLANYLFPDRDNPSLYLEYAPDEIPKPRLGLDAAAQIRAKNTLELMGLARDDTTSPPATDADRRWRQRVGTWADARRIRRLFEDDPELAGNEIFKFALRLAVERHGFFSVWMAAFQGLPLLRSMVLSILPGTALACFDAEGNPVERL